MTRRVQANAVKLWFFTPNIFNPQLVESTAVEPIAMQGHLYHVDYVITYIIYISKSPALAL